MERNSRVLGHVGCNLEAMYSYKGGEIRLELNISRVEAVNLGKVFFFVFLHLKASATD